MSRDMWKSGCTFLPWCYAEACEILEQDLQQFPHWACWQLGSDDNHIILSHLLQDILQVNNLCGDSTTGVYVASSPDQ